MVAVRYERVTQLPAVCAEDTLYFVKASPDAGRIDAFITGLDRVPLTYNGKTAAEQLFDAGVIGEPTEAALIAYINAPIASSLAATAAATAATANSVAKTASAVTATGAATTAAADAVAKTALTVSATSDSAAQTALTVQATVAANSAAAQIVPDAGPSLLIKPGTGTFPSVADTYFTGEKSLYSRFDGVRRNLVTFPDVTDFTRASAATYFDKTGTLQTAAAGVARLGYRYVGGAWVVGGLIAEAVGTNQLLQSQNLTGTPPWNKVGISTPTNTSMIEDTANSGHYATQNAASFASGTICCLSAIASELGVGAKRYFTVLATGNVSTPTGATFDLASGTITATAGVAVRSSGIVPVGPGQWLCWVSYTSDVTSPIGSQFRIQAISTSIAAGYLGDGVSGLNVSECQIETAAPSPSSRIRTTTATVTRAADTYTKTMGPEFNPAQQTALLSFVVPQGASGLVDDLVLYNWADASAAYSYRVFYRASQKRVYAFMSLNGVGSALNGPVLVPGDVCKVAFGFSGKIARMAVNGVSSGDVTNTFTGAFVPFVSRRLGVFNANGQANTTLMLYLPHPTNPLLDASEFPRLLTIAEMQAYTA